MPTDSIPNAKVKLQIIEGDFSWIVENCPHCGRRHIHGAFNTPDKLKESLGVRLSHCGNGQYNLVQN